MCMFTEVVEKVSDTNIFACALGDRQTIVYGMSCAAKIELAMVLPIPVVADSPEDAVPFINLENCPGFFDELRSGFPTEASLGTLGGDTVTITRKLEVHDVGSFEASFVPRPEDFGRLDERFRLPADIWLELNNYRDWGFAVFKLKKTPFAKVHPMAVDFPRRDRGRLFFPILHLHHRRLERSTLFDHALYCQPEPAMNWHLQQWEEAARPASAFVRCAEGARLLDLEYPCWQVLVGGNRENRDT